MFCLCHYLIYLCLSDTTLVCNKGRSCCRLRHYWEPQHCLAFHTLAWFIWYSVDQRTTSGLATFSSPGFIWVKPSEDPPAPAPEQCTLPAFCSSQSFCWLGSWVKLTVLSPLQSSREWKEVRKTTEGAIGLKLAKQVVQEHELKASNACHMFAISFIYSHSQYARLTSC